jgi:hypothetical protein
MVSVRQMIAGTRANDVYQSLSKQRALNYVGWVGHNNLGDEALYAAIKKVFNHYTLVPSNNSLAITWPMLLSGITLFGGGTLLPRWPASVMPNRFNYAYGVGVVDPGFFTYQYGTQARALYELAICKTKRFRFRLIGVRGEKSRRLLENWGIKSQVVGDPCLLLEPSSSLRKEENLVAVSVGSSEPYEPVWGKTEDVAKEAAKLCLLLRKEGYNVVLVPFSDVDVRHVRGISKETGLPVFKGFQNVQSLLDFVSRCTVLVGQRLHSMVLSAAALTPFLPIEYHSKCSEFSESVGFQEYAVRADKVTAEELLRKFRKLVGNWDSMYHRLRGKVEVYKRELSEFAFQILEDIESLPEEKWQPPEPWSMIRFRALTRFELSVPRYSRLWNR